MDTLEILLKVYVKLQWKMDKERERNRKKFIVSYKVCYIFACVCLADSVHCFPSWVCAYAFLHQCGSPFWHLLCGEMGYRNSVCVFWHFRNFSFCCYSSICCTAFQPSIAGVCVCVSMNAYLRKIMAVWDIKNLPVLVENLWTQY